MRFLALLIPILLFPLVWTKLRMVVFYGNFIYGYVTKEGEAVDRDSTCTAYYGSPDGRCRFVQLSNELHIDMVPMVAEEKGIMGIKTEMPEGTCPANYTDVDFKMVSPEGEILPWRQNKSNELWIFRICFKGWTQFIRSDSERVCMKFINESGITKNNMAARCYDELPYYSKLAGVYSDEESVWMQEEIAKYAPPIGAEIKSHWTSGVRDGTCENTYPYDKRNQFKWGDNITTGITAITEANSRFTCKSLGVSMNCLVVMSKSRTRPQEIFGNFDCDSTVSIG